MMGFLKDNLGMTVLRHEEFDQGCEATWYILVYVFFSFTFPKFNLFQQWAVSKSLEQNHDWLWT